MYITDFKTRRLKVNSWAPSLDHPAHRATLKREVVRILTPNVLAPLPDPLKLPQGTGNISAWIEARAGETDVYCVRDLDCDELVGLLILAPEGATALRLGYLLADPVWGRGYGTELVRGLLDAVPKGQGITVLAGVHAENAASCGVLYKAGFELDPSQSDMQMRLFRYVVA